MISFDKSGPVARPRLGLSVASNDDKVDRFGEVLMVFPSRKLNPLVFSDEDVECGIFGEPFTKGGHGFPSVGGWRLLEFNWVDPCPRERPGRRGQHFKAVRITGARELLLVG